MRNLEVVIVKDEDALVEGDLCRGEGEEEEEGGDGGRQQHGLQNRQPFVAAFQHNSPKLGKFQTAFENVAYFL